MLWLALILILLWALGAFVVPVGGLIHLLLIVVFVVVVYELLVNRRVVP